MDFFVGSSERSGEGLLFHRMISDSVQLCPFLRNIGISTNFSFSSSSSRFPEVVRGNHGPIFEDGPNFDLAFKLFHGQNGVVPLAQHTDFASKGVKAEPKVEKFHPLAASAATISLSAFGASGPFGFDAFMSKRAKLQKSNKRQGKEQRNEEKKPSTNDHEAWSNEWLQTGNCPIAKSFRAVSGVLPLVAKVLQPPPNMKFRCPPAIVAARAALARTAAVKVLKPQPLPTRVLAVGMLGMALNVPLGIWREHTEKFSPAWFTAVHASVPFIAMLRKAVHMPKYAMAFTFAASILGQVIGSRAERRRIQLANESLDKGTRKSEENGTRELHVTFPSSTCEAESGRVYGDRMEYPHSLQCGKEVWGLAVKTDYSTSQLRVL